MATAPSPALTPETDTLTTARPVAVAMVPALSAEADSLAEPGLPTGQRAAVLAPETDSLAAPGKFSSGTAPPLTPEADTATTARPIGSQAWPLIAERDFLIPPTSPDASSAQELALADAIVAPDRVLFPTATAAWDGSTGNDDPFLSLDSLITEMTITRSLEGELPAEVGLVEGHSAATASLTLAGEWLGTGTDPVDAFAPYKTTAAFYARRVIGVDLTLGVTFRTALAATGTTLFTGSIASVSPSSANRSVELRGLDGANKLRAPISLAPYAIDSLLLKRYGEAAYFSRINSQWLIDYVLRQNGIYASPPPQSSTVLSATLHGSTIPELGLGGIPQEYAAGSPPTGPAWINDGHPFGMLYPNPAAPAMTGSWKTASQVAFTGGYVWTQIAAWVRLPATSANQTADVLALVAQGFSLFMSLHNGKMGVGIAVGSSAYYGNAFVPNTSTEYSNSSPKWARVAVTLAINAVTSNTNASVTITDVNGAAIANRLFTVTPTATSANVQTRVDYNLVVPVTNVSVSVLHANYSTAELFAAALSYRTWTPEAVIDPGANNLYGIPAITNEDSWELLKDVVGAEYGSIGFDRDGIFWFRARDAPHTRTRRELITSERNLADLQTTTDEAGVRNYIATTVTPQLVGDWEWVFEPTDPAQLDCGPGVTVFNIAVTEGTTVIWTPATGYFLQSSSAQFTDDVAIYSQRTSVIFVIVKSNSPTVEITNVAAVSLSARLVDYSTVQLTVNNKTTDSIRFATADVVNSDGTTTYGQPAFKFPGRVVRAQPSQTVSITDSGSIATYGPRTYDLGGDNRWHQHPDSVNGIASAVLASTAQPTPVLEQIEVPHDPRRALHDAVRVVDQQGLGQVDGTIVGIETRFSADQAVTDLLDVRPLGPPGLGVLDDPDLGIVGSTLVFGS